jgi:hypothetical protein
MDLQEDEGGRGDWMELAQDRDRWRALVGTVPFVLHVFSRVGNLRKATINLMSSCPSVHTHGTIWLPLDGFSEKFDI